MQLQEKLQFIAHFLHRAGVNHAVICPGSRDAPLAAAFDHSPVTCFSVIDERSAAFAALGMSRIKQEPVAVLCTSGSATANLFPAITEAFYLSTPLIAISADRPPELLDCWDGQTIMQQYIFGKHAAHFIQVNADDDISAIREKLVPVFSQKIFAPVHINMELREPLYELINKKFVVPDASVAFDKRGTSEEEIPSALSTILSKEIPILLLIGAGFPSDEDRVAIELLFHTNRFHVISDIASGVHYLQSSPTWEWAFMLSGDQLKNSLGEYALLTIGTSHLSKNLKTFIRNFQPVQHFHIDKNGIVKDQFFTSPVLIRNSLKHLSALVIRELEQQQYIAAKQDFSFNRVVHEASEKYTLFSSRHVKDLQNEFDCCTFLFEKLQDQDVLHLASSMPGRYASMLLKSRKEIAVYTNRGVSGIDGCVATATGMSKIDNRQHFLLCGDIAFAYDNNILWNKFAPSNLVIIVLNNRGGGIFRMIQGPSEMQDNGKFVFTPHDRNFSALAAHYEAIYHPVHDFETLEQVFTEIRKQRLFRIVEIFTDTEKTAVYFNHIKQLK